MEDLYSEVQSILGNDDISNGQKKVQMLKILAEAKCQFSRKKLRDLTPEEVEHKKLKCAKKKQLQLWWEMRTSYEPIQVQDVTLEKKDGQFTLKKL